MCCAAPQIREIKSKCDFLIKTSGHTGVKKVTLDDTSVSQVQEICRTSKKVPTVTVLVSPQKAVASKSSAMIPAVVAKNIGSSISSAASNIDTLTTLFTMYPAVKNSRSAQEGASLWATLIDSRRGNISEVPEEVEKMYKIANLINVPVQTERLPKSKSSAYEPAPVASAPFSTVPCIISLPGPEKVRTAQPATSNFRDLARAAVQAASELGLQLPSTNSDDFRVSVEEVICNPTDSIGAHAVDDGKGQKRLTCALVLDLASLELAFSDGRYMAQLPRSQLRTASVASVRSLLMLPKSAVASVDGARVQESEPISAFFGDILRFECNKPV